MPEHEGSSAQDTVGMGNNKSIESAGVKVIGPLSSCFKQLRRKLYVVGE